MNSLGALHLITTLVWCGLHTTLPSSVPSSDLLTAHRSLTISTIYRSNTWADAHIHSTTDKLRDPKIKRNKKKHAQPHQMAGTILCCCTLLTVESYGWSSNSCHTLNWRNLRHFSGHPTQNAEGQEGNNFFEPQIWFNCRFKPTIFLSFRADTPPLDQ